MIQSKISGPWLIGGPGRSGKTYLAETLYENDGPVAGFPLEGLFTVYNSRWITITRQAREAFVQEYLTRPRYIDAGRDATQTPVEYFKRPPARLRSELPAGLKHPVTVIGWILDRFAEDNGRSTWAAFDLHPEFLYPSFRRRIPDVKLAAMVRDAREAIGAALYWRGNPGKGAARDARFKHSLILYCLSVQAGRRLAGRWQDDVQIFDFNALVSGDQSECRKLAKTFGVSPGAVRKAFAFRPHFSYEEGKGFYLPDGSNAALLSGAELAEIELLTGFGASAAANSAQARQGFLLLAKLLLVCGWAWPTGARTLADFIYYPGRTVTRRFNSVRRLASDLWQGLRRSAPMQTKAR